MELVGGTIVQEDVVEKAYRKVNLRLIPFLFLCYIFAYFARVNVSFAKLQMLTDLGWSETAYGLGAGIFFIGYIIFAVPSNLVLAKIGPRFWIGMQMIAWGITSGLLAFATTPFEFYIFRLLTGVAEAGFFPGIIYYFTKWYPSQRRGRVISLFMVAIPVSGVLGGSFSGWLMQELTSTPLGLAAWQWLFITNSLPTILLGALVPRVLPNSVDKATFLDSREKRLIVEEISLERNTRDRDTKRSFGLAFLKSPAVWYFAVVYFLMEMGEYAISFWMPSILRSAGFNELETIGWLTAGAYLVAGIAMLLVGRSSDNQGERRWHLVLPLWLGMAGLIIAGAFSSTPTIAVVGLVVTTTGILASMPIFWTIPSSVLGASTIAAGVAFINSVGNLAGFVSPYLVGWTKDVTGSTNVALYVIASFALLGSALVLRLKRKIMRA